MILNQQWAQYYSYNHGSIAASYILYNGTLKKNLSVMWILTPPNCDKNTGEN